MYFEYRIVKIEKGLFLIEYKTAPYGVWHEVDKKFKTKGNVSHKKAMIKGMAARSAEFVERYSVGIADCASDLK